MSREKLILLTIGPVQSFIEQSRKTIDFYAGSRIINRLTKWSYEILCKELNGMEILYPNNDDFEHFPNYFLAKVAYDDEKVFVDLEEKLKDKLKNKIKNDIEKIFKSLDCKEKGKLNDQIVRSHIDDCFDVYIVYEEYHQDKYSQDYKNIYKKLNAAKNTRKFKQMRERGRKCSVCGIRNGIFYNEKKDYRKSPMKYLVEENTILLKESRKLKDNETLCYICFLKRFFDKLDSQRDKEYPSTVKLATLGWINRKDEEQLNKYNKLIKKLFEEKNIDEFDEKIYYDDWILDKLRKEKIDSKKVKETNEYIKKLYKYKNDQIDKPTKYYAVVKIDIDDLGKWLSGEYFDTGDLLNNQKNLSKSLFDFSKKFLDILKGKGKVVYAGGDDFLYFVTLDKLFQTIEDIEKDFQKVQNLECIKKAHKRLTFSTSIVVAHYKTPLQRVLKTLNETLDEVKERYKNEYSPSIPSKNAVVFSFITYSNTLRTTYFQRKKNIEYMKNLIMNLQQNLSRNFIYSLENEFYKLSDNMSYLDMIQMKKVIGLEMKRLVYRAWDEEKEKGKIDKQIIELKRLSDDYFIEIDTNEYELDFNNYFNFLHISEALSKELYDLEGGDN